MFSNLSLYRLDGNPSEHIEDQLAKMRFKPCEATQNQSIGWFPPRGDEHDALCESVGEHRILAIRTEAKMLPASVVHRSAEQRAKQIEAASGKKLGRAAMKDLREEEYLRLLPRAFTKLSTALVWINPERKLVGVEATSPAKADEIATLLLASVDGITLTPFETQKSAASCMATWLLDFDPPGRFAIDRECELKAYDETQAVVRYSRHNIETEEVQRHIKNGKSPKKLALTWADRVSFVLTDTLQLKKIKLLESVMETDGEEEADPFDGNVALICGELSALIPDLVEALGGEAKDLLG